MTKRKPGIRPIGENRTIRIVSERRVEPDLALYAQALAELCMLEPLYKRDRSVEDSDSLTTEHCD